MIIPPKPHNEAARLKKLYDTGILDTQPEKYFDEITLLAAEFCDVPIALVTLIDSERQWIKSKVGLDAEQTTRDAAFCAYTILGDDILEVEDAQQDERFIGNPLVEDDPRIRFYAGAPLTTSSGLNLGSLCVISDEPKKGLNEKQKAMLTLLARNVVKGIELHEELERRRRVEKELRHATAAAERATRLKAEFLAAMTHELRTPLNSIIGYSNLLASDPHLPEQVPTLEGLMVASNTLLGLVNNVLDFSKLEEGKLELSQEMTSLASLINEVELLNKPQVTAKGLDLLVNVEKTIPARIKIDKLRLSQVLNNLVSNAVKFTNEGSITISAELQDIGPDKARIQLSVKDTGIGIAPEKQEAIFDQFSQEDTDTTHHYGGTGLGLSISKQLVSLMGGELALSSHKGKGSTFYFSLNVSYDQAGQTSAPTLLNKIPEADFGRQPVLVVDDSEMNLMILSRFLTRWNLNVIAATSGKEAMELAHQYKFKLVLMDLHMPELDGYETTTLFRNQLDAHYKTVPILALTASLEHEVATQMAAAGFSGYLSKPFSPQALFISLKTYLVS